MLGGPATPERYGQSDTCLNPNVQQWNLTFIGSTPVRRYRPQPRTSVSFVVHPGGWTMHRECIQGHEWETYVALETFLGDGTRECLTRKSGRVSESRQ